MKDSQILAPDATISVEPPAIEGLPAPTPATEPDPTAPGTELSLTDLGFESPGALPGPESPIQDILLYGLIPHPTSRPDLAIIQGVATELEALTTFAEGPLQTAFDLLSRRLRTAIALSQRTTRAIEDNLDEAA